MTESALLCPSPGEQAEGQDRDQVVTESILLEPAPRLLLLMHPECAARTKPSMA